MDRCYSKIARTHSTPKPMILKKEPRQPPPRDILFPPNCFFVYYITKLKLCTGISFSLTKRKPGSIIFVIWACSAVGSAPHSHCGGREFESPQVHQQKGGAPFRAPRFLLVDRRFEESNVTRMSVAGEGWTEPNHNFCLWQKCKRISSSPYCIQTTKNTQINIPMCFRIPHSFP